MTAIREFRVTFGTGMGHRIGQTVFAYDDDAAFKIACITMGTTLPGLSEHIVTCTVFDLEEA